MTCQSPTALSNNSITFDGTDTSVFWWCSRLLFFYYLGRLTVLMCTARYSMWCNAFCSSSVLSSVSYFSPILPPRLHTNLKVLGECLWECPIASPSQSCWEPQSQGRSCGIHTWAVPMELQQWAGMLHGVVWPRAVHGRSTAKYVDYYHLGCNRSYLLMLHWSFSEFLNLGKSGWLLMSVTTS